MTYHVANGVVDQDVEMVARDGPHHGVSTAADCLDCVLGRAVFEDDLLKRGFKSADEQPTRAIWL